MNSPQMYLDWTRQERVVGNQCSMSLLIDTWKERYALLRLLEVLELDWVVWRVLKGLGRNLELLLYRRLLGSEFSFVRGELAELA